ncbi:MAG TPA: tetratricopeptide repeat protein [Candidatus Binataceae bacterium]|nr:tetratricopeptide repeat protein [Candidatus Binataceae bacterium]
MRFCPECGTPVTLGAKFCVGCGTPVTVPTAGAGTVIGPATGAMRAAPSAPASGAAPSGSHFTPAFAVAFAAFLAVGLGAAAFIMRQEPQRERSLATASTPGASGNLPPGHPAAIKIPDEARKFIDDLKAKADAAPKNIAAWDRFGDAAERAAMFDPSYYPKAEDAYAHVLKLDPDDLAALRGVGNIDYDRRRYDEAIAAYEHYLSRKPDDSRVRTDLGTMYLSSGNPDVAIVQYKKVIAAHPDFFEAYFNLGVAYAEQENKPVARGYFLKARTLAPDDKTRGEIDQMLATIGAPGPAGGSTAASGAGAATVAAVGNATTFQGAFEQMARGLAIAGPKVHGVQWTDGSHARLLMDNFPMDQMPPFAAARFLGDLKSGTAETMKSHHVPGPVTVAITDAASNRVMQSVTVTAADASAAAGAAVSATSSTPSSTSASSGTFQDAVAAMMRNLPVAGSKVAAVQWPSTMRAKVMMDNFPMDAMPPFARDKFIADIKAGLSSAKSAHKVAGTVTVDIADAQSGRVMESVSQ